MLEGLIASDGVAIGQALLLDEELRVPDYAIRDADVKLELLKFDASLALSRDQLVELKERNQDHEATAKILESQLLILVDPLFVSEVIQKVRSERRNVEKIVEDVIGEFARSFHSMDNAYMKERAIDVQDVGRRILRNLIGQEVQNLDDIPDDTILVCHTLTPSDIARIDTSRLKGVCCEVGGVTSHAAILARSLMIPALVGVENIANQIHNGDTLIVDCINGKVRINPAKDAIEEFEELRRQLAFSRERLAAAGSVAPVSTDGVELALRANISVPTETSSLKTFGARGVGLYRTEYLYLKANSLPPVEEQLDAYRRVAVGCAPDPAIIRTLDIGGDKNLGYLGIAPEQNPFLGFRSIRYSLHHVESFKTQMAAILRASAHGKVKMMFPMISTPQELERAKAILEEVKTDLDKRGTAYDREMPVGIMIEVPSAALVADLLAPMVDFFSIGTNDLFQFTLAVDRTNQHLASMFDPVCLPMARLIKMVVDAAGRHGTAVSCCGELASIPVGFLMLLGLGVRDFSMNMFGIPRIKQLLANISVDEVVGLVREALENGSSDALKNALEAYLQQRFDSAAASRAN